MWNETMRFRRHDSSVKGKLIKRDAIGIIGALSCILTIIASLAGLAVMENAWGESLATETTIAKTTPSATAKPQNKGSNLNATSPSQRGIGLAAMQQAAMKGKYLFMFFYSQEDEQTDKMRSVFDGALKKAADRAVSVHVNITDSSEKMLVDIFRVARAPMPLVLAIAPNGAVTQGYPQQFNENQLLEAFVSPATEQCLRALQSRRMVMLCVQNKQTRSNEAAMQGVNAFKSDARYANGTEIVMIDPADPAESGFLKKLKIDPATEEATTILLAPPGAVLGKFVGGTNIDDFVATVTLAQSGGCAPGSSPGCCPKK